MMNKIKIKRNYQKAFTLVELTVAIAVVAIIASVTIVAFGSWRNNLAKNEAQSDLKQLASIFESSKNFGNGYPTSIPASYNGSSNLTVTYVSGDASKYCIEARSKMDTSVVYSIKNTSSEPTAGACIRACDAGDTQSGSTCTNTYAATYNNASYSCSSGTLSGSNCVTTYNATYSNGSYTCPNGDTLSGSQCYYAANSTRSCPNGGYDNGGSCMVYNGSGSTTPDCQSRYGGASSYWINGFGGNPAGCYSSYQATYTYNCNRGGTLSGSNCYYAATSQPGGYTCPSGGTLNGTTCTRTTPATSNPAGYTCPNGGTLNGSTCTRTYPART